MARYTISLHPCCTDPDASGYNIQIASWENGTYPGPKLVFKEKTLLQEIADRKKIRKIYEPDVIINAVKRYFKVSEDELLYKKSKCIFLKSKVKV